MTSRTLWGPESGWALAGEAGNFPTLRQSQHQPRRAPWLWPACPHPPTPSSLDKVSPAKDGVGHAKVPTADPEQLQTLGLIKWRRQAQSGQALASEPHTPRTRHQRAAAPCHGLRWPLPVFMVFQRSWTPALVALGVCAKSAWPWALSSLSYTWDSALPSVK